MKPYTIFFTVFAIVYAGYRFYETWFKGEREPGRIVNKWSLLYLNVFYIAVGVITIAEYYISDRKMIYWLAFIGVGMVVLGTVMRHWATVTLGKYHSAHVELREGQPLICTGPYRYLRHPYYFGVLIEMIGLPFVGNAIIALVVTVFFYIPGMIHRLWLEEREMKKHFGEEYIKYCREVGGLFPRIRVKAC